MPRSGYDMTSMLRAGQKPRPAESGAKGLEDEEEQKKKKKKQVTTKAGDGPDKDKNKNDNDNNDNDNNGPAPLQKKERTIDDVRVRPGTGWTFWL